MIEIMERKHIGCRRNFCEVVICGIFGKVALMGVGASAVSWAVI